METASQILGVNFMDHILIAGDNLFVIGRCISADFDAISALRIIPSCFSMGEGLAKYLKTLVLYLILLQMFTKCYFFANKKSR